MATAIGRFGTRVRNEVKVRVTIKTILIFVPILGVYMWASGIKAPIKFKKDGSIGHQNRLIFPEEDFRMEYRGTTKEGSTMHGDGTLILKNEI